ncbi:hypothetical protein CROQUDRAFT_674824 [Cronartium quercuum f. sp. fusiforme G11]|uniref:Large ribosomal subunit protein uL29m n=1 Tax=Cronartium quercuum f. sp. fusiforme G11 TaxID=708437 RepID=A0A9P6T5U6_9BASI|nr:hypothetical protein CROQUDRAFT_674824 [Cronartium quercuum f. sp. fusiforme G11]
MIMPFPASAFWPSTTLQSFKKHSVFLLPLQVLTSETPSLCHPRLFHSATQLLARRSRERDRPKPPIHPSVPSYKASPEESHSTVTSRRRLLGIKTRANSDEFAWKLDSSANVMRRRDGITGKYEHSKVDWISEKRRKFFKLKREEYIRQEDERYVARRSRDPTVTDPTDADEKPAPPKKGWSLPSRAWNRGAPSLVEGYGREANPIYSFEQRQALAFLRETALTHERRRQEMLSQATSLPESQSQDPSFWDYERNFRNPLYDFFRGGVTMEESSVSDSTYHCWSVPQLRRKSFQDLQVLWYILLKERNLLLVQRSEAKRVFGKLVDPANPGEPLSTIRNQLKAVQFSLRNIKVTVSERRRAIESRINFLTKYQAKRGRDPFSQQWQIAMDLENQRIQTHEGHERPSGTSEYYFALSEGRDRIKQILSRKGLRAGELLKNMEAFDLNMSTRTPIRPDSRNESTTK